MKSNLLTKNQVAGIVKKELTSYYFFLYCYALLTIILVFSVVLFPQNAIVTVLIYSVGCFGVTYSLYKTINSKILELKEKYEQ